MNYVMVAGEGDTSRENVEAILEDFFYAHKGEESTMVVPFKKVPSRGQVYAMQMAKDNKAEVIIYSHSDARLENVDKSSIEFSDDPIEGAISLIKPMNAKAYVLWSDDSQEAVEVVQACKEADISVYDLTSGGIPLNTATANVEAKHLPKEAKPLPKYSSADIQKAVDELIKAIKESILNDR